MSHIRPNENVSTPAEASPCPVCGCPMVPIAYGYPGPDMFDAADRGDIVLGGCMVPEGAPVERCVACWPSPSRGSASGSRTVADAYAARSSREAEGANHGAVGRMGDELRAPADTDLVDMVVSLGGEPIEVDDPHSVDFLLGDVACFVYLKDGGSRLRGTVILDDLADVDVAEAEAWVARQPQPESGLLEVSALADGSRLLRILFERSVDGVGLAADPLLEEAQVYAECWRDRLAVEANESGRPAFVIPGDLRDLEPANAWLLLGDQGSFPSPQALRDAQVRGQANVFEYHWTTSKQTDVGDLVLIYFTEPRRAAHFVARAASRAFFDREIGVNAEKKVADEQWWCFITPPVEIEPIPVATLRRLADGHLPLHGKSGVYLRPEVVAHLPIIVKRPQDATELDRVLRLPVGRADLPHPDMITAELWTSLASGVFDLESQVEQYVVEPLLRLALTGKPAATWEKSRKIGRTVADYVVLVNDAVTCVIEVKLAVRQSPDRIWANSKDFQQVRRYADALGCRSALVDANRIYLIDQGAVEPNRIIERRGATAQDFEVIGAHLGA